MLPTLGPRNPRYHENPRGSDVSVSLRHALMTQVTPAARWPSLTAGHSPPPHYLTRRQNPMERWSLFPRIHLNAAPHEVF